MEIEIIKLDFYKILVDFDWHSQKLEGDINMSE
jgi:hypothetical protein